MNAAAAGGNTWVFGGMARATGLEPAASGVTGRRSNQLSYARSAERAWRRTTAREPLRVRPPQVKQLRGGRSAPPPSAHRERRLVRPAEGHARQHGASRLQVHLALALVVARVDELYRAFH